MNLPTIEMPAEEARKEYLNYRRAIHDERYAEDAIIRKSYLELSKGNRIVNVRDAIKAAGANEDGSPKLAIARADDQFCYFQRSYGSGEVTFCHYRWFNRTHRREVFEDVLPVVPDAQWWNSMRSGRSVVPTIPLALRPSAALSNYHILWEAEWQQVPVDPALLKRIQGDVFAVLEVWDLTEVERMALGLRREQ